MLEEEDRSGSLPCLSPIADIRLSVLDRIRGLGCCIRRRIPRVGANDPAVVLPGNVTLTHRNLLAGCSQLGTVLPFNAKDKVAVARPLSTVIGLVPAVLLPLFPAAGSFSVRIRHSTGRSRRFAMMPKQRSCSATKRFLPAAAKRRTSTISFPCIMPCPILPLRKNF